MARQQLCNEEKIHPTYQWVKFTFFSTCAARRPGLHLSIMPHTKNLAHKCHPFLLQPYQDNFSIRIAAESVGTRQSDPCRNIAARLHATFHHIRNCRASNITHFAELKVVQPKMSCSSTVPRPWTTNGNMSANYRYAMLSLVIG